MNEIQVKMTCATESQGAVDCFGRRIDEGLMFQLGGEEDVVPRYAAEHSGIKNCSTTFALILVQPC